MKVCLYPGSFDPFTLGHLDILERASKIFEHVVIGVLDNTQKKYAFSREERMEFARLAAKEAQIENVEIATFDGLTVEFARQKKAGVLIRGLRAVTDFEYELQMAAMNKKLAPDIETMFMMTNAKYSYLSASIVREIGKYSGELSEFVPHVNLEKIEQRLRNQ